MKKCFYLVLISILAQITQAEPIYVGGVIHRLTIDDFTKDPYFEIYTAYVDVHGNNGQDLIFYADAHVAGIGTQRCPIFGRCDPSIHYPYFRFAVRLDITCADTGFFIGADAADKNEYSHVMIRDKHRELDLAFNRDLSTGSNCNRLEIVLNGGDLYTYGTEVDYLYRLNLDLLIAEQF